MNTVATLSVPVHTSPDIADVPTPIASRLSPEAVATAALTALNAGKLSLVRELLNQLRTDTATQSRLYTAIRAERVDSLRAFVRELKTTGYSEGAVSPLARQEDSRIVAGCSCEECGSKGLRYRGFRNPDINSYRAVCICDVCGHWDEF